MKLWRWPEEPFEVSAETLEEATDTLRRLFGDILSNHGLSALLEEGGELKQLWPVPSEGE